jgi:hypothetical protein
MALEWNAQERAQQEARRQQAAQQQALEEGKRRAELRGQLGYWRAGLAAHEEALPRWQEEHRRRLEAQDAAWAAYLTQLHAEGGGELPRGPGGQLISAIDMGPNDHPETLAARPARPQWQAFKQAEQDAIRAADVVRKLEAAIPELRHNVRVCSEA